MTLSTLLVALTVLSMLVRAFGEILKGNRDERGWLWCALSYAAMIVLSGQARAYGLVPLLVIAILAEMRGWKRWTQFVDDRRQTIHRLRNQLQVQTTENEILRGEIASLRAFGASVDRRER